MGSRHQLISAQMISNAQRENLICLNVFKNIRERYLKCCACQVRSGKRKGYTPVRRRNLKKSPDFPHATTSKC